jgi:hypothetical protein
MHYNTIFLRWQPSFWIVDQLAQLFDFWLDLNQRPYLDPSVCGPLPNFYTEVAKTDSTDLHVSASRKDQMCVEGGMLYQLSYRKVECRVGFEPTVLLLCRQLLWTTQPSAHNNGGAGEIRTHGPISGTTVFKTVAINQALPQRH